MADNDIGTIKIPLIEQGKRDIQESKITKAQKIQQTRQAAINFLNQIDQIINSAKSLKEDQNNTAAITNHQNNVKDYYQAYLNAIQNQHNELKEKETQRKKKELIAELYKKMTIFQNKVNQIVNQFPITIFVVTLKGEENKEYFIKFDEEMKQFYDAISIDKDNGNFKYNISESLIKKVVKGNGKSSIEATSLRELLTTKGTTFFNTQSSKAAKSNSQLNFAKDFSSMLQHSFSQSLATTSQWNHQQSISSFNFITEIMENNIIVQELLKVPNGQAYRSKNATNTIAGNHIIAAKNSDSFPKDWDIITKSGKSIDGQNRYELGDVLLKRGEELVSLHEILNSPFIQRTLKFNVYGMSDRMKQGMKNGDENVYHLFSLFSSGSEGWLKEAFFGAYFGLEDKTKQLDFMYYYKQLDAIKGRLTGDYSTRINNRSYEIQIKSHNAQVTIFQFIELAYWVKTTTNDKELIEKIEEVIKQDRNSQKNKKTERVLSLYKDIANEAKNAAEDANSEALKAFKAKANGSIVIKSL